MQKLSSYTSCLVITTITLIQCAGNKIDKIDKSCVGAAINEMCIDGYSDYKIMFISKPVDDVCLAAIEPPYREFPNIIFFKYDANFKKWERVVEGLCVGIQFEALSRRLDLHTVGKAADATGDKQILDSYGNKSIVEASEESGLIIVLYQNFFHTHEAKSTRGFYFIDKTSYPGFAANLMGDTLAFFKECTPFDTPSIIEVNFNRESNQYKVIAKTDNNQLWTIRFEGIDADYRYLLSKEITFQELNYVDEPLLSNYAKNRYDRTIR